MRLRAPVRAFGSASQPERRVGPIGYLALLLGPLGLMVLAPPGRLPLATALCLGAAALAHPAAFRRLWHWRWLVLLGSVVVANSLWLGPPDRTLAGLAYSGDGLQAGLRMALRSLVVLLAVDGFSSAVDVTQAARLLERAGLPGLGFCIGVAFNLLPSLRHSGQSAWHSLRMRGGLRRQRWRALRLLLVTVVANALRRAQDIALAAEARGFTPDRRLGPPLKAGPIDWLLVLATALVGAVLLAG